MSAWMHQCGSTFGDRTCDRARGHVGKHMVSSEPGTGWSDSALVNLPVTAADFTEDEIDALPPGHWLVRVDASARHIQIVRRLDRLIAAVEAS